MNDKTVEPSVDIESLVPSMNEKGENSVNYELVRECGHLEIQFQLWTQLQMFSNICISATYQFSDPEVRLTPGLVYPALKALVKRLPGLSIIPIVLPSKEKKGHHRTWEGRLKTVGVSKLVEWRNDWKLDPELGVSQIHTEMHNVQWYGNHETSIPHWKIVVLDGRTVTLVADHFVLDGLSGFAFHRGLRKELNRLSRLSPEDLEAETSEKQVRGENEWTVSVPKADPAVCWFDHHPAKLNMLSLIWGFIMWYFVRFFYRTDKFPFSDSTPDPAPIPKDIVPFGPRKPTTGIVPLHIPEGLQSKLLSAARENHTSLTALVATTVLMTLASDLYPNAKFSVTSIPFSIRPFTTPVGSSDSIHNYTSAWAPREKLGPYRAAHLHGSTPAAPSPDKTVTWRLAADYKRRLMRDITVDYTNSINQHLALPLMGNTNEDYYRDSFSKFPLIFRGGWKLSNLGRFEPRTEAEISGEEEIVAGPWNVVDAAFSLAAEKSTFGTCGITLGMAGADKGGSWVFLTYEVGVVKVEVAEGLASGIKKRLEALVE